MPQPNHTSNSLAYLVFNQLISASHRMRRCHSPWAETFIIPEDWWILWSPDYTVERVVENAVVVVRIERHWFSRYNNTEVLGFSGSDGFLPALGRNVRVTLTPWSLRSLLPHAGTWAKQTANPPEPISKTLRYISRVAISLNRSQFCEAFLSPTALSLKFPTRRLNGHRSRKI